MAQNSVSLRDRCRVERLSNPLTLLQMDEKLCSEARADAAELYRLKWERDLIYTVSRVPVAALILEKVACVHLRGNLTV